MKVWVVVRPYVQNDRTFSEVKVEVPKMLPYVTYVPRDEPRHDRKIIAAALWTLSEDVKHRDIDLNDIFPLEIEIERPTGP
jgi:hypothetical protein